ncbi:MAG: homoaconitate hydratase [Thermoprotei archaeon]|nr:MAG: homoaconitate hydratase [Thermoprotei archaeon]
MSNPPHGHEEDLLRDIELRGVATSLFNEKFSRRPTLYDTTLRDGEQTPGVSFEVDEKVEVALKLEECGLREIEVGFPAVSDEEMIAVREVCKSLSEARALCLCRALRSDVDLALKCDVDGVIVFIPSSLIHLKWKLKLTADEALKCAVDVISYAKSHGLFVQFTCEDATRTPLSRLLEFYSKAIEAGADRIGVADTAGCITPTGMKRLVSQLSSRLSKPIAVHCHNDFGLATANTLAAYEAGASALSVSVNGLGERCGNAPLEEVALALRCLYGVDVDLKLEKLVELSRLVAEISGLTPWPLKPIVGSNAFSHESGIHVAAVLENPFTYEPYSPSMIGVERRILFGKHSGLKAVQHALRLMGLNPPRNVAEKVLEEVKREGLRRGVLTLDDVKAIASRVLEEQGVDRG